MSQISYFWGGTTIGDAATAAPYDDDSFSDVLWELLTVNRDTQGVRKDYLNELEVTDGSGKVSIDTGSALVDGKYYKNDASYDVTIPTPSVSTRIDCIVLRKSWAAQTVRITRVAGTEGAAAPAITQIDGTTWDLKIAEVSITTGGVITVTDYRSLLQFSYEIATPTEVNTGTDNVKVISPYSLKNSNLNYLLAVAYQPANASEVNAGVATNRLVTPASLGGSYLDLFLGTEFDIASGSEINTGTASNRLVTPGGLGTSNIAFMLSKAYSEASASDVSAGTANNKLMTPDSFAESERGKRYIVSRIYGIAQEVETGDGIGYIQIPDEIGDAGYKIIDVEAWVDIAGVTSSNIIQLNNGSNDILTTRLYIDTGQTSSKDSSTQASINASYNSLSGIRRIRVDGDQITTTAPYGLVIKLTISLT